MWHILKFFIERTTMEPDENRPAVFGWFSFWGENAAFSVRNVNVVRSAHWKGLGGPWHGRCVANRRIPRQSMWGYDADYVLIVKFNVLWVQFAQHRGV